MAEGLLEGLEAAIADLANVDVESLTETEVHDAVVALGPLSSRLEAVGCRLVGVWDGRRVWADNGSKSAGARLARETHLRRADADRLVNRARQLAEMPATANACAAGEITGAHVDLIASCNREWRHADFAESEEFLVDCCRTRFFGVAVKAIAYWKLLADRDAEAAGADPVRDGRHLSASVGWRGELVVDGVLDPVGGEIFKTELDRICEELRLQDLADGVLVPYLSDADVERIVYDPPGRRIEASYRRRFTGALRRIIEVRDQHCQHDSGCDEPARRCDVDHITPHPDGVTCLCNGQLLCAHHNRTVKAAKRTNTATRHPCPHDDHHPLPANADLGDDTTSRAPPAAG